jgi:energy-coupling factor transporter ATP-binding protein EcfA2
MSDSDQDVLSRLATYEQPYSGYRWTTPETEPGWRLAHLWVSPTAFVFGLEPTLEARTDVTTSVQALTRLLERIGTAFEAVAIAEGQAQRAGDQPIGPRIAVIVGGHRLDDRTADRLENHRDLRRLGFLVVVVKTWSEVEPLVAPRPIRATYQVPEYTRRDVYQRLEASRWHRDDPKRAQRWMNQWLRTEDTPTHQEPPPEEDLRSVAVLERIQRVKMTGFRGIRRLEWVSLEGADLVILTGPNGYGKSTFLYGLQAVLTGSIHPAGGQMVHTEEEAFEVEIDALEQVEAGTRSVQLKLQGDDKDDGGPRRWSLVADDAPRSLRAWPTRLQAHWLGEGRDLKPETIQAQLDDLAALSGLQQDRDPAPPPDSLAKSFLERLGGLVTGAQAEANEALNRLTRGIEERRRKGEEWATRRDAVLAQAHEIAAEMARIMGVLTRAGARSDAPVGITPSDWVTWLQRRPGRGTPLERFREKVDELAEDLRGGSVSSQQVRALEDEKTRHTAELYNIAKDHPELDLDMEALEPNGPDDMGLDALFDLLAENIAHWQVHARRWPTIVRDEVLWVRPGQAQLCADLLKPWAAARRDAVQRRRVCRQELDHINAEIRRLVGLSDAVLQARTAAARLAKTRQDDWAPFVDLMAWDSTADEREREDQQARQDQAWYQELKATLDELAAPSSALQAYLQEVMDETLRRFAQPVRLTVDRDQEALMGTADGRQYENLSAGQRAMFRVAKFLALREAVEHQLGPLFPHRILMVDDPLDAFDPTNLQHSALIWRQVAYGGEDQARRQVFLAIHQDLVDAGLVEMLRPFTDGRRAVVVRFNDYDPEEGPKVQVEPLVPLQLRNDDYFGDVLTRHIEEALCPRS